MELVHYDGCLRHDMTNSVPVCRPHVHGDAFDVPTALEPRQVADHGLFLAVAKHVDDGVFFDVRHDATGLLDDVDLVDPHPLGRLEFDGTAKDLDVIIEDVLDRVDRDADVVRHVRERSGDRLLSHPFDEPGCHQALVVNAGQALVKGLTTGAALVAAGVHVNTGTLPVGWQVADQLFVAAEADQVVTIAVGTQGLAGIGFSADMVVEFRFLDVGNGEGGQVEDVYRH